MPMQEAQYDQIFKEIYDDAACVPLYYCEKIFAMNSHVKALNSGLVNTIRSSGEDYGYPTRAYKPG